MIRRLHRLVSFCARFLVGVRAFGLRGALKAFGVWPRYGQDTVVSVPLLPLHREFMFRALSDRGVLCQFYTEGFRVLDVYGSRAKVIIDAGANIGDSTMRLRHFHPSAKILAIEADADNYAVLAMNFDGDGAVSCLHRALWKECGEVRVCKTWANIASRVNLPGQQGESVRASAVPDLMAEFDLDQIDILKLDIEGAEAVIFQTQDLSWLQQVKCIVFECCDADDPGTSRSIFEALARQKWAFLCHVIGENLVLVREGTPWHVVPDLWLEPEANVPAHVDAKMKALGLARLN